MRAIQLCIILLVGSAQAFAAANGSQLHGHWKITGIAGAQDTTSLSSDQADLLAGSILDIGADSIGFNGETCHQPSLTVSRHNKQRFFRREFNFDPIGMPLPDIVTEFRIDCKNPSPIHFIYVRDKRQILFYWKGFFLNAVKERSAPATSTPAPAPARSDGCPAAC